MKNYDLFIGIDVSKLKLDITGIDQNNAIALKHSIIKNTRVEIKKYFVKTLKNHDKTVIVGFENTGVYSALIALVLHELDIDYCLDIPVILTPIPGILTPLGLLVKKIRT